MGTNRIRVAAALGVEGDLGGHTKNCGTTELQECLHFGSDEKGWTEGLFKEVTMWDVLGFWLG